MEGTREIVATYPDPAAARRAITTLERHGVDAAHIHLIDAPGAHVAKTDQAMREPDMAITRRVGRRGFAVAIIVAIVAAAAGAGIAWLLSDGSTAATLIAAAGCFAAGGPLGFFYGGASAIAVSEDWGATYETTGRATLAVTVNADDVVDLRERIEHTSPDRITVS